MCGFTPPTRDLAHKPGMCPDWESNWQPFGLQAGDQSAESHQPGLDMWAFKRKEKSSILMYL